MIFYGWEAIGVILLLVLAGGGYIALVLIGFNRDAVKRGLPPIEF